MYEYHGNKGSRRQQEIKKPLTLYRAGGFLFISCRRYQTDHLQIYSGGVRILNVQLGVNGIETAQEIREYDSAMKIIFLTSSAEYAVESYTVNAYFYQLKPIWPESFYRLMDSVLKECAQEQRRSLILRCKSGITQISLDRLMYCEVQGRTLVFHMQNGEQLESVGSMDDLSGQLAKYNNFLRAHRSYLVNMEYIKTISSKAILMVNQDEIPVPHGKCSEIKNQYLEYAFSKDQVVLA